MTTPAEDAARAVWKAIYDALDQYGDSDIKAGIAWLEDADGEKIAAAAIHAMPGFLAARAEERAAVVAWLRRSGANIALPWDWTTTYAEFIERGDHIAKEP